MINLATILLILPLLLLLTILPSVSSFGMSSPPKKCVVKICHNKDCTKKGGGAELLNTFRDLIPLDNNQLDIQSSGCLSQCGKGPNVCVVKNGSDEKIYHGVKDALDASAMLDVATPEAEYPIELLVAASTINQAEHTPSPSKKEELMTSVITDLSKNSNPALMTSFAMFHALTKRADARLETNNIDGAVEDAKLAAKIYPSEGKVWRILASAEEQRGSLDSAIVALTELARADPSFATKAKNEIERLST
jgi:(2Fe-2S) ferredoxin